LRDWEIGVTAQQKLPWIADVEALAELSRDLLLSKV
jgi:hypothetical protein